MKLEMPSINGSYRLLRTYYVPDLTFYRKSYLILTATRLDRRYSPHFIGKKKIMYTGSQKTSVKDLGFRLRSV